MIEKILCQWPDGQEHEHNHQPSPIELMKWYDWKTKRTRKYVMDQVDSICLPWERPGNCQANSTHEGIY